MNLPSKIFATSLKFDKFDYYHFLTIFFIPHISLHDQNIFEDAFCVDCLRCAIRNASAATRMRKMAF